MRSRDHKSKERILTQSDPAKVRRSAEGIVLKAASLFLLCTEQGDIPFDRPHGFGLFWNDCRYLDGYRLTINGADPVVMSGVGRRGFETQHHVTNPELAGANGAPALPKNSVAIARRRIIRGGVVHELITIRNVTGAGAAAPRAALPRHLRGPLHRQGVRRGARAGAYASPPCRLDLRFERRGAGVEVKTVTCDGEIEVEHVQSVLGPGV